MWIGNTIYFRSDRNGEFNLFSYNTSTKKIDQLTNFKDFPVLNASAGNGVIVFEQAGYLHTFTPGESDSKKIKDRNCCRPAGTAFPFCKRGPSISAAPVFLPPVSGLFLISGRDHYRACRKRGSPKSDTNSWQRMKNFRPGHPMQKQSLISPMLPANTSCISNHRMEKEMQKHSN